MHVAVVTLFALELVRRGLEFPPSRDRWIVLGCGVGASVLGVLYLLSRLAEHALGPVA